MTKFLQSEGLQAGQLFTNVGQLHYKGMLSPYAEACKFESSNLVSISPWKVSTVNRRPIPQSTVDSVFSIAM